MRDVESMPNNVVTYDKDGVPLGIGMKTLENLGFIVGQHVCVEQDTPMTQWKLMNIINEYVT